MKVHKTDAKEPKAETNRHYEKPKRDTNVLFLWADLNIRSHLKGLAGRLMFWNGSLVRMLKERKGREMKQATSHVSPTAR